MALNDFDGIVYINLDHRKDRNKRILSELVKIQAPKDKIHRISAFHTPLNGHKGCAYSHLCAIKLAMDHQWETVLILEDDCLFDQTADEIDRYIGSFLSKVDKWDVFFLSTNLKMWEETSWDHILRVKRSHAAHAYVVNRHYYETLYNLFKSSYELLEDVVFYFQAANQCLDVQWNVLQEKDLWYVGKKPILHQGNSFSDIEMRMIDKPY